MDSSHTQVEGKAGKPPGTLERAFVVFVLLLASGAFMTLVVNQGQMGLNPVGGSIGWGILWVLIYLTSLGLIYHHCPGSMRQFLREWPLVMFVGLAVLSTLWSGDPSVTFRRSIALSLTVMFGYYLARRFSLREQLHLLAWVCGISIVFSVPFGLLNLGATGDFYPDAWHGIFTQKDTFGRVMTLGVVVFLVLAKAEPKRRWRIRLGILAALILLALSHYAAGIIVTAAMFILMSSASILRKSLRKAIAGVILVATGGIVALFWVLTHWMMFTRAFGRGVTLSGRLELWLLCVVMALQKPWLGYGYSAFWLGTHGPSWRILRVLPNPANFQANNGFIQTWLDLGLAGVALLILILAVYVVRAALVVRRSEQPEAVWPLMILVFCLLYMLTEGTMLAVNAILPMVFSSCVYSASDPMLARPVDRV